MNFIAAHLAIIVMLAGLVVYLCFVNSEKYHHLAPPCLVAFGAGLLAVLFGQ